MAALAGDVDEVAAALHDGASVNGIGSDGCGTRDHPLSAAARRAHVAVVTHLLAAGADPDGGLAVTYAASLHSPDILEALIDAGCAVNGAGKPLFNCVMGGSLACLAVLLAQPSLDLSVTDVTGRTVEELASANPCVLAIVQTEV